MRESWYEFVTTRLEAEREAYSKTEAGRHRRAMDLHNYNLIENNLTNDQRTMVDEIMFERCVALERDGERLYQQGMKDAVWLLKKLGVLGMEV